MGNILDSIAQETGLLNRDTTHSKEVADKVREVIFQSIDNKT